MRQHPSPEEDLGLTDSVKARVQLKCLDHLLASLLPVHEALGNHVRGQQLVPLAELLEGNSVGESLATDPDALEDSVAPKLVQHQWGVYLSGLLLVVGDNAADEVRVGVPECDHQLRELLLIELGDGAEHPLPGDAAELGVRHRLVRHPDNLRCDNKHVRYWYNSGASMHYTKLSARLDVLSISASRFG